MSGSVGANLPARITLDGAQAVEDAMRRVAQSFAVTARSAEEMPRGVARASEAFGTMEGRAQGLRRRLGDLSGALQLLGATGGAGSVGAVASYVGNLADLFGTAGLAAGQFEGAAGALSARLAAIAGLVALPVLLQSVGLGISRAGEASITAAEQTAQYEDALESLRRAAGDTTTQLQRLAEAQRVAQLNNAITSGEIALGREFETRAQLPEQLRQAQQRLQEAERDRARAEQRAAGGSDAARAAVPSRVAAEEAARAEVARLRALEAQTEERINQLSVERSLALLRRDNPPSIDVTVTGAPVGGGGGGGGTGRVARTPDDPALTEAQRLFDTTRTAAEQYEATLVRLAALRPALEQLFGPDGADEVVARRAEQALETLERANAVGQQTREVSRSNAEAARDLGLAFSSAFEDAIVRGASFRDLLKGLEQDLIRIGTRRLITEPLVGVLAGNGKDDGGIIGSLVQAVVAGAAGGGGVTPSANGNAFDGAGLIPFARGGVVNGPTIFPFANGIGLMGEAGPEAIMPLKRGPDGRLGVQAQGGGGGPIVVNISTPDADSFRRSEAQMTAQIGRMVARAQRNL